MRLDDFDPNDINVEDQRGQSFGGGGGGGGGLLFGLLPLIGSRFGCGGIVVVLLLFAVFGGLGNLGGMLGGGGGQVSAPTSQRAGTDVASSCNLTPQSKAACNAFQSAENTWTALFEKAGQRFQEPKLVFFGGSGKSGCGAAQAAMGPFYCPTDQGIYLDTSFFDELATRFGAKGDFAQDYVIAHEFGHHIQNLLGTSDQVQQIQRRGSETEGNAASVRLELQADCYAGVWAAQNRSRMEPGDLEEGLTAAQAIGDDTLQKQSQGRVVPDSFTHGTSAQRQAWLQRGLTTGDPAQCDTFSGAI
ncbi:zinc metallopeptidase [Sphingomonadaceae bacterium OTU29LAMAA1]|uniref:KPN_02809 family neutral zinc metallopeptidase n=1 Tax=Sphingomonas sp. Leaf37 TaxID=2876552 RepID=UPI001E55116D|nr:neutral zinc metallopeptidase [Sphingomonas sp. Leaf37]USU04809.1 zinc metallopeptidase [Sphingomonadaceae bacterium OTU29LAMAA1]